MDICRVGQRPNKFRANNTHVSHIATNFFFSFIHCHKASFLCVHLTVLLCELFADSWMCNTTSCSCGFSLPTILFPSPSSQPFCLSWKTHTLMLCSHTTSFTKTCLTCFIKWARFFSFFSIYTVLSKGDTIASTILISITWLYLLSHLLLC